MSSSLKSNFLYNIINTITGLVFPLITYPYAFRILMADGIGTVNFLNSIISYVILLTSLGIPLYGIREVARIRDNPKELTKITLEILSLNLLLNVVGYIVVIILAFTITDIHDNLSIFLLLSSSIVLTSLGCQWFYSGIEDFKFITIRGLIVRICGTILLFFFVKDKDDVFWYAVYTVLITSGNYIINFLYLRTRISFKLDVLKELDIWRHIKPALAVFAFNLVTSIYLNLDKVMLGFIKDSSAVGFYTAATQISHILLTIATALGAVMLPRSSNLIELGKIDEFYRLANKSYNFILMLTMPLCIGCVVLAPVLIHVFCGVNYDPAITTLQIICPIIIAIGMSNLIGLQMLYPMGLIRIVTISTCVGAAVNLVLNLCLIPSLSQNGAAIATVLAETSVTLSQFFMARKYIKFNLFTINFLKYLVSALAMGLICSLLMTLNMSDLMKLIYIPLSGIIVYVIMMFILRDSLACEIVSLLKSKLRI